MLQRLHLLRRDLLMRILAPESVHIQAVYLFMQVGSLLKSAHQQLTVFFKWQLFDLIITAVFDQSTSKAQTDNV